MAAGKPRRLQECKQGIAKWKKIVIFELMKRTHKIYLLIFAIIAVFAMMQEKVNAQVHEKRTGIGEIIICDYADAEKEVYLGEGNQKFNHSNLNYYFMTYNFADWGIEEFVEERVNLTTGARTTERWKCRKDVPGVISGGDFAEGMWQIKFYKVTGELLGESYAFEVKY